MRQLDNGLWVPDGEVPAAVARRPPIKGGAARTYAVWNAPNPTTAAPAPVTTGTAIKTLLQIATSSTVGIRVIEWGVSFDAVNATPVKVELVQTDVAATVTAYVAADITRMNGPNDAASTIQLGVALSGYTATAEGTTTVTRVGDYQLVAQSFVKQFPLGREFEVPLSRFLRVRVTAAVASNAVAYVCYEE